MHGELRAQKKKFVGCLVRKQLWLAEADLKKDVQEKTDIKCKIKRWTKDKFRKLLNLIKTRTTTHLRQLLPHKSMSLENETLAKFWERGYWSHQSLRKSCWGDHLRCRISPWIRQLGFLVAEKNLTPGVANF